MSESWQQQVSLKARERILFTRQLLALLHGGVSLLEALETLAERPETTEMARLLGDLCQSLLSGAPLSRALSRFPLAFPPVYLAVIRAGERTGRLLDGLSQLVTWMEAEAAVVYELRRALSYPALIVALSALLTFGLFAGVLPHFAELYASLRVPLPALTRLILQLAVWTSHPLFWLAAGCLTLLAYRHGREVLRQPPLWVHRLPVLGPVLHLSALARFNSTLASVLQQGLTLTSALRLAAETSGSPALQAELPDCLRAVENGGPLWQTLAARPNLFPPLMIHLVAAGEESARLPRLLRKAAEHFSQELENRLQLLTAALEPILLTTVGSMVALVLLSLFLPLYAYLDHLQG